MCRVYLYQASIGKSNHKIGKTRNYPSLQKHYSTSCKCTGSHKEEEKNSKSEITTLTFLYNLKK